MNKGLIGMMAVLVLAAFVIGLNINDNNIIPTADGIKYGSDVCVYKNDELIECKKNTVTNVGLRQVKEALGAGETALMTNLTLGNASAPLAASTALDGIWNTHGLAGATGTYGANSPGDGNWSVSYTWTATAGGALVNTTALYNTTTGLFAGTSFTATTLQTDDQLKVNYTIYVT